MMTRFRALAIDEPAQEVKEQKKGALLDDVTRYKATEQGTKYDGCDRRLRQLILGTSLSNENDPNGITLRGIAEQMRDAIDDLRVEMAKPNFVGDQELCKDTLELWQAAIDDVEDRISRGVNDGFIRIVV
jgi:hypothetical protein